jgi:hypothetical protein
MDGEPCSPYSERHPSIDCLQSLNRFNIKGGNHRGDRVFDRPCYCLSAQVVKVFALFQPGRNADFNSGSLAGHAVQLNTAADQIQAVLQRA